MTREELIRSISKVPEPYVINPVVKFYAEGQLREYEQQIRADAIEEFRKFNYCKVCEEKGWDIYCEYCRVCQAQEYIAEQLKEQKNE